jgi:membrane dipeptidase
MSSTQRDAAAVHNEAIVIDGCSFFAKGWHERLEKAGVTALQMTVPWPWDGALQGIRRYREYYDVTRNEPRLRIVRTTDDIRQAKADGVVGLILGAQNAQILENDPGLVEVFHVLGSRVIQLAYNERNLLADGCLESSNAGLSRLGKTMVKEMNRVGIQIDLTHTGEQSSLDAIELSSKPCIISHANPNGRVENPRNISDTLIKACAEAGGVVGLTPYAPINWMGGDEPPSLDHFIGHLEYVVDLVGIDHVSFGTDSEVTPGAYPPEVRQLLGKYFPEASVGLKKRHPNVSKTSGFESMEDLPNVTAALLDRGWQESDVRKFLGENLMRVYAQNWEGAA